MTGCTKCSSKNYHAKGLCRKCYNAKYGTAYRAEHREEGRVYATKRRRLVGIRPMGENRECALFLGVHVAERVLRNVFKDVEQMPNNNPGYDFICNRGKKIDVKSSTTYTHTTFADCWVFRIARNTIADFFLCIAFDNRNDLTPLHMWLIPGNAVNDKLGIRVSVTTIDKWDEYRIPIDKVVSCCNEMKTLGEMNRSTTC